MLQEMDETGRDLTIQDIELLEHRLDIRLPEEYRIFLIQYNGGAPEQAFIDFDGLKINVKGEAISYFYGIGTGSEDIEKSLKNIGSRNPSGLIPIADTASGNFFLLSVRSDSFGAVFYRDHEYEDSKLMNYENGDLPSGLVLVRTSFTEFISDLYE